MGAERARRGGGQAPPGHGHAIRPGVPRWPATIALLALGTIYLVLSDRYVVGPRWLVLAVVVALLIPLYVSRRRGYDRATHLLARLVIALMTLAVAASAVLLLVVLAASPVRRRYAAR